MIKTLVPLLAKPDHIIIHIGTNEAPYKKEDDMYEELKSIRDPINRQHPACKGIIISTPVIRQQKANTILRRYDCVKSVRIRSYSGLHFPAFGLNTERCGVSSVQMRENADQNNSDYGHFLRSVC